MNKHLTETLIKNREIRLAKVNFVDAYNREIKTDGIAGALAQVLILEMMFG